MSEKDELLWCAYSSRLFYCNLGYVYLLFCVFSVYQEFKTIENYGIRSPHGCRWI